MFRCPAYRRCGYFAQVPGTKDETLICAVGRRRISHPSYTRLSSLRTGSSALVDVMTLSQFLPHPRHFTPFPYPTLSSFSTSFSSLSIVFSVFPPSPSLISLSLYFPCTPSFFLSLCFPFSAPYRRLLHRSSHFHPSLFPFHFLFQFPRHFLPDMGGVSMKYDTRCYFNVRSKADISQLNLLRRTEN